MLEYPHVLLHSVWGPVGNFQSRSAIASVSHCSMNVKLVWILYYLCNADSTSLIIQECSGFSSLEERRSSMSTQTNYFRSEDAYLGVAKYLQKLTISESIKNAGQRRELATVTPAGEQNKWIWGCSYVLLRLCRAVCQDGHVTAGDTGHITAQFWKKPWKCRLTMSLQRWGSQNSDAVESCWLLETQLLRPQINPEMVSPWEKEWSSGRCTLLSLLFFSLYLFMGPESTFIL